MKGIKKRLIVCVMALAYACVGGFVYAAGNFHNPHIKIWDFGRAMEYMRADLRDQAYDFYAAHIDMVESADPGNTSKSLALKQRNPDVRTFTYQLDITQCQHQGCGQGAPLADDPPGATEAMYLHYADTTTCRWYRAVYGDHVTFTVPGCADPNNPTKDCRVLSYIWGDYRYVYNQKNPAFRTMMADKLIAASDAASSDGVFLDEHGPGVGESMGFYPANLSAGGHLLEYGGKRFHEVTNETNTDLTESLAYLKQELSAHNKFIVINGACWSTGDPLVLVQEKAAGGTVTEFLVRPTVGDGGEGLEGMFKGHDEILAAGGKIDLLGNDGRNEIPGLATWTPGNYDTNEGRWRMWRLAYYYLMREMPGTPGEAYFSPDLNMGYWYIPEHALDFIRDWLPAYEVNVGLPDGPRNPVYAQGTGSWCNNYWGGPIQYTVFSRSFDNNNVLVLLRGPDNSLCRQYGDNSGVVITLDQPRYLLREDGTFPAQPANTVMLRQSESAILFASNDLTNYSISGTVTHNGLGLAGVILSGLPNNPVTNALGQYTARVTSHWGGTVTPTLTGYAFTPANRSYGNLVADQTGQDHTAAAVPTYTISGTITYNGSGLAGVMLNGLPGFPLTNASGQYTATVNQGWSGTVMPSRTGYTFTPTSLNYTDVVANQTGRNYEASAIPYTITGTITYNGSGLSGVTLIGLPGNPVTDTSGQYTANVHSGWSGIAMPSLEGYTFAPGARSYAVNQSVNQAWQDYTARVDSSGSGGSAGEGGGGGGGGGCFIGSAAKGSLRGGLAWFLKLIFN